ncbi:Myosin-2 [Smittium culicis]|uniref:Myosin-2 n=1 Tax=Smittium culicis TaxID=133412 RepID=A0A1R1XUQ1_9FUNG|nr:Myosin-2 [Smittium culicis]
MTQEIDLEILKSYSKGTNVYFPDDEVAWIQAVIESENIDSEARSFTLTCKAVSGRTIDFTTSFDEILKSKNDVLPPLCNPPILEGIDDLTSLSHLHEPAVLHNLKIRYSMRNIYTYSGIVLVAMNPFSRVQLYSQDILEAYAGRMRGEMEPHLFAIAEDAYQGMIRDLKNQTIIVSGESGAGKTVSAKYIIRYFASAHEDSRDSSTNPQGVISQVEEMILATNPVLESFGNAKTTRNDNSSRFGKYLEIEFNKKRHICGANIKTYLLERSRLVYQPPNERNYHIFYQLIAATPQDKREILGISKNWNDFYYTNQGGANSGTIVGVDDAKEFQSTCDALQVIGVEPEKQWDIFKILAGLLHIGEINFKEVGRGGASIPATNTSLDKVSELLGLKRSEVEKCLIKKVITMRSEKIVSNLNQAQALVVRDSMAKYIYSHLFDWIVSITNVSLKVDSSEVDRFIGVLDIYGFEHFETNSFEQFCINYANEKLQQHFNRLVFKLEQEEYQREQLTNWTFIEFNDNQNCIELIEGKLGIMDILDEESRLQQGSDQSTLEKLYSKFADKKNSTKQKQEAEKSNIKSSPQDYFIKPRFMRPEFTVCHYAHDVTYSIDGFVEKNRDTVSEELQNSLKASSFSLLSEILTFQDQAEQPASQAKPRKMESGLKKPTLGTVFKQSLIQLMKTIEDTNTHYIRCIKPNETKASWEFDPTMVLSQLRACGVLETIRISCAGYPSRLIKNDFLARYNILYPKVRDEKSVDSASLVLMESLLKDESKYQIGLTKVFFRAGVLAQLERMRNDLLNNSATTIQKNVRRYFERKRYVDLRNSVLLVQSAARSIMSKRFVKKLTEDRAVFRIQSLCRRYLARSIVKKRYDAIIKIISISRVYLARKKYAELRRVNAATKLQALARGYLSRKVSSRKLYLIVRMQSAIKAKRARIQLSNLKRDAKSAEHFKEVSYKLEGKLVDLTRKLQFQEQENAKLTKKSTQLDSEIAKWKSKHEDISNKLKSAQKEADDEYNSKLSSMQEKLKDVEDKLASTIDEKNLLSTKLKKTGDELESIQEEMITYKSKLEELEKSSKVERESLEAELSDAKLRLAEVEAEFGNSRALEDDGLSSGNRLRRSTILVPPSLKRGEQRKWEATTNYTSTGYDQPDQFDPSSMPFKNMPSMPSLNSRSKPSLPVVSNSRLYNQNPANNQGDANQVPGSPRSNFPSQRRPISVDEGIDSMRGANSTNSTLIAQQDGRDKSAMDQLRNELKRATINGSEIQNYAKALNRFNENENVYDDTELVLDNEEEVQALLENDDGLFSEILNELISNLEVPIPNLDAEYSPPELLFPAHLIGLCIIKMFQFNLSKRIDKLLVSCIALIQKKTMTFESDFSASFWLSNVFELLSIVKTSMTERQSVGSEYAESERAMTEGMQFLESLLSDIYFGWAKNLQRRFIKLIIPGVVESEALPGFTANDSSFFNRIIGTVNKESVVKIEHVLNFFNNVWKIMEFYYVDVAIMNQVLSELLCTIGVTAFNNIIMRRNFCSWKRGMQIQYNLTRIEEWCKSHNVSDNTGNLDRLLQLVKLLQLQKSTDQDIEIMFDVCDLLNPAQIKKILSIYAVSDYESPILGPLMPEVNRRAQKTEKTDKILLDTNDMNDQVLYLTARKVSVIETLIPPDLRLVRLRALVESQTEGLYYADDEDIDLDADIDLDTDPEYDHSDFQGYSTAN